MSDVVIDMDPHKRSATIEIINDREQVLGQGRFRHRHRDLPADAGLSTSLGRTASGPWKAATASQTPRPTAQPLGQLERHRPNRRLQRRPTTPSPGPRRQPTHQPVLTHHGHRAAPPRHRSRAYYRRTLTDGKHPEKPSAASLGNSNDARPTPSTNNCSPTPAASTAATQSGPGRTPGGDCDIQRGRPNPYSRLFGSVTSRTRHTERYPSPRRPLDIEGSHDGVSARTADQQHYRNVPCRST